MFFSNTIHLILHANHNPMLTLALAVSSSSSPSSCSSSSSPNKILQLQDPHGRPSPAQVLRELSDYVQKRPEIGWDVYGDYNATSNESFLRRFEEEMAYELGMDDAVFMPSGVMAQSIALLLHQQSKQAQSVSPSSHFICHESSHLLLHEQEGYRHLLHQQPLVVSTQYQSDGISIPGLTRNSVEKTLKEMSSEEVSLQDVSCLLLELPHRELGGKLNTWDELLELRDFCHQHGLAFHCDGARLLEATTGLLHENDKSLKDVTGLFDSVYVSCYKGLGGLAGAFLLGPQDFCDQARVWLRRFGGNLFTLLPYAVAAHRGFHEEWKQPVLSFVKKKQKLAGLVQQLSSEPDIHKWLSWDPATPDTPMIHGYLRGCTLEQCQKASNSLQTECGVQVVRYFKPVLHNQAAIDKGYRVMFEWTMGSNNGQIEDPIFLQAWRDFCQRLHAIVENEKRKAEDDSRTDCEK